MKNKIYIPALLLSALFRANAQEDNLIPNPGFEQYNYLPQKDREGISCVALWKNPVITGSGDYYHAESKIKKYRTGKNQFGKQQPHSGKAFAGVCISKKSREYLQIQLLRPLEKDKEYRISVFISCADKIWLGKLDEFGIIFSKKEMSINSNNYLIDPPAVVFRYEKKYKNKRNWIELSTIYKASGYEKVMTFGSFLYREKIIVETKEHGKISGAIAYAHYYVDDLSIVPLDNDLPVGASLASKDLLLRKATPAFSLGKTYNFKSLQFETGKSELLSTAYSELNELIIYLKKNPSVKILIRVFTDSGGDAVDNMELSYKRAQTVMSYLLSNEIDKENISIEGKGNHFPVGSNNTEAGTKKNQRVEISFF